MNVPVVLTVIGVDRPGLVDLLATVVARHDGNWLESRMARLGGQFAGILRAEVPAAREAELTAALQQLAGAGLAVTLHSAPGPGAAPTGTPTLLQLVGQDRPGIVRQISGALARHGVNVEELETGTESAPMTGETLFRAQAQLRVPARCDTAALQSELERIGADLMVEISLNPPP